MEYKTNQDLVDKVYNFFKEEFNEEGGTISEKTEEIEIDFILDCYLFNRYKNQEDEMEKVKSIAQAIEKGQPMEPIFVDHNNNLIDGFHRVLACKEIGISKVICLRYSGNFVHQEMK